VAEDDSLVPASLSRFTRPVESAATDPRTQNVQIGTTLSLTGGSVVPSWSQHSVRCESVSDSF